MAKRAKRSATAGQEDGLQELIVLPVRNMILFPGVALPLMVGRDRSIRAIQAAMQQGQPIGLLLQRDGELEEPGPEELYTVGTIAEIVRYWPMSEDRHNAICQASERFEVVEYVQTEPYLVARVRPLEEDERRGRAIDARFRALRERAQEVLELAPGAPEDLAQAVAGIESPNQLAYLVATFMDAPVEAKQELLETHELRGRLDRLIRILGDLKEVLELSHKIRQDTRGTLDKAQREYFLREQLRSIRKELGEEGDVESELDDLRRRVAELPLDEAARELVERDLQRLSRTPEQSAEHPMLRTWVETLLELPWALPERAALNLRQAEAVLEEDHYGLERVKTRILEALAVRKRAPAGQGTILCLVGPPGVGKTSLGRSVARALGRPFARVALGGVHDEAEVRGHRRTYVGAMPGRILKALQEAGAPDPVFVLDEVDKLGRGIQGDPSAALLEVLDPAQNGSFTDAYLGVPFDLSRVFFLATANVLHEIPGPLRDRMEVLELPGYTEEEKLQIAKRHLWPEQLEAAGLGRSEVQLRASGLKALLRGYTREAGVRELARRLGALCRHAALRSARGRKRRPLIVDAEALTDILGPAPYEREARARRAAVGVATGLAWTPVGGELLFIEAASMPGKGELVLTGHLGEVMQESARIAVTLARANSVAYGLSERPLEGLDLHLHVPQGAVPKDGPSAGVALTCALVSLLSGRKLRADLAMTGEVSLRGAVLPVGGIKEKVLAALASGIRTVALPRRNLVDLEEVPAEARERMEFIGLDSIEQALELALQGRAG